MLVLAALGAGVWRYRITRPDYRLARGREAVRVGDWAAADDTARRLESAGHADSAHLLRGELLLERKDPGAALKELGLVRSDGPFRVRAASLSGRCLLALGDLREAQRALSAVVSEQPDDVEARRGLAAVAYDLGHLGDAVGQLEAVAELDPADVRPHRLIGLIYKDLSQDALAEAAYREALRRGPKPAADRELRTELAEVLAREGKYADGIGVLDGGTPAGADDPAAAAARAECLRGLGRPGDAADVLDAALAVHPTVALYRVRGQVYLDQGNTAESLRCLERATQLDPADHQSNYLLGQAYAAAGRPADAARTVARVEELRADLDRVTTLTREAMANPWDPAVRLRLADTCDRMGRPELARMWRKAAASCSGGGR